MTLTRDYHEAVQERVGCDPARRQVLLAGVVARLIAGEVGVACVKMRDYVSGTVGFEGLGEITGESSQHLEQVLGAEGVLSAGDLFEKVVLLAQHEDLHLGLAGYLDRFGEPGRWDHFAKLGRKVRAKWWYLLDFRERRQRRRDHVLTGDVDEIFQKRVRRDRKIRKHFLNSSVESLILGEVESARRRLHTYIIGAVGFERLGAMTGESPQHLEQVFNTKGGLTTGYLFEKVVLLAHHQGVAHELSNYLDEFSDYIDEHGEAPIHWFYADHDDD